MFISSQKKLFYSQNIDCLRGVFAVWVLFIHLSIFVVHVQGQAAYPGFLSWINNLLISIFQSSFETHPAVLGFIVLSGYCIHRNGLRTPKDDLRAYSVRRVFRILPVYVLAIIVGVCGFYWASHINLEATQALSATKDISSLLVISKLLGLSAFIPQLHYSSFQGNAPLHTVMVEIWLYILYPIILFFIAPKRNGTILLFILSTLWVGGIIALYMNPQLGGWWHNGSVFGFLPYWWLGASLLDENIRNFIHKKQYHIFIFWLVVTLVLQMEFAKTPLLFEIHKLAFAGLVGCFIILLDHERNEGLFGHIIGRAGYSIYAFHAPILYLMIVYDWHWFIILLTMIFSGIVIYEVIEKKFIGLGKSHIAKHVSRKSF